MSIYAGSKHKYDHSRDNWDHQSYNDKYYGFGGFDPTPPNIRIAPGFRKNHHWRIGGMYYGKDGYDPGYWGTLWFGYEIEF